jgi:hypothetical protein
VANAARIDSNHGLHGYHGSLEQNDRIGFLRSVGSLKLSAAVNEVDRLLAEGADISGSLRCILEPGR